MRKPALVLAIVAMLIAIMPGTAKADTVTFTGSSGSLAASVTFTTLAGGQLQVTLSNTASVSAAAPAAVLTGFFFNLTGATLTPVSALLASGSSTIFAQANCVTTVANCAGSNMGGEWGYGTSLNGLPFGATQAINSSGNVNGLGSANFNGPNLWAPANGALDGVQAGLVPVGQTGGNAAVNGGNALVMNSVIFTLSGLPANWTAAGNVTNVSFQYGTALTEPNYGGSCTSGCTPPP
ncbi:MAG: hypothetical protein HY046_05575, partial [Acidobacteria bacterium]|nr:hypothetical protein [Acidobacteriota bacterium]